MKIKGVILHGGQGTRLRPLTQTGPKQLIPVGNKPISQYALEDLKASSVADIAIILGDLYPEKVKAFYGDGSRFGVRITYITQGSPRGIAHAISLCKEFVGDNPFVVYLGDNLIKGGIKRFVEHFISSNPDAQILLCQIKDPTRFGVPEFDRKGNLKRLLEKPKRPPSDYALTGIYFLKPSIFNIIQGLKPSWRGELEITDALQKLIETGQKVSYETVTGWWKDNGTPEDILEANRLILDDLKPENRGLVHTSESLQGRVSIGKGTEVEKGAVIRGPTIIGEKAAIKASAYIGPYTSIGNRTVVKSGEIENSIIMDDCIINVKERIVDSLIGPRSDLTSSSVTPKGRRFILGERSTINM